MRRPGARGRQQRQVRHTRGQCRGQWCVRGFSRRRGQDHPETTSRGQPLSRSGGCRCTPRASRPRTARSTPTAASPPSSSAKGAALCLRWQNDKTTQQGDKTTRCETTMPSSGGIPNAACMRVLLHTLLKSELGAVLLTSPIKRTRGEDCALQIRMDTPLPPLSHGC